MKYCKRSTLLIAYKEINSILLKLEKEYLELARSSPENTGEGIYGVYAIKKVRNSLLNLLQERE
tara:strand:+ start:3839 stop:4030 length:192 start_codon:yes stop_codon:yes gene_type:complete